MHFKSYSTTFFLTVQVYYLKSKVSVLLLSRNITSVFCIIYYQLIQPLHKVYLGIDCARHFSRCSKHSYEQNPPRSLRAFMLANEKTKTNHTTYCGRVGTPRLFCRKDQRVNIFSFASHMVIAATPQLCNVLLLLLLSRVSCARLCATP